MILCFSGTGNSLYVAKKVAASTSDCLVNLNDRIRQEDYSPLTEIDRLIVVTPTFAWRIPRIVSDWLRGVQITANIPVWFIMTCGGEIGNAGKYNEQLCDSLSLSYMGTYQVIMPENYIAMFDAPDVNEAREIIEAAQPSINAATAFIQKGLAFPTIKASLSARVMSGIVNPVFYAHAVKADSFYTTDSCVSCGKCVQLCPLENIQLTDGKPVWGKKCTHCMACICHCPVEAIEYGNKSKGKPRYHCDEII